MEMDIKTEENEAFILGDGSQFTYTRKQVEISNILGTTVAVLDEYFITNSAGENYKLYKTKEGNWYDMTDVNHSANNSILRAFKSAIDYQEQPIL
jgi:hypothetical protein